MALWDKLKTEIDRAGRAAQGALDEGKLRLDVFRARQLLDRAAMSLGFAVYKARRDSVQVDESAMTRLHEAVAAREAEVLRLEERLREAERQGATDAAPPPPPAPPPSNPAGV